MSRSTSYIIALLQKEMVMNEAAVHDILERIRSLPQDDRLMLERRLAEMDEAQWQDEAAQARRQAHEQGVDQTIIDRAVDKVRYGG